MGVELRSKLSTVSCTVTRFTLFHVPSQEAASRGNFKAVRKRVESGGDINQEDVSYT